MITKQKGTYDVLGLDAKKRKYVCEVIDAICEKYNYTYYDSNLLKSYTQKRKCDRMINGNKEGMIV